LPDRSALVVGYHVPESDRDSGARRLTRFIDLLQEDGWTVRFLAADGIGSAQAADQLRSRGIRVHDGYQETLAELLRHAPVDLAFVSFWVNADRYLTELRDIAPRTRVVVDSVDLHFMRDVRRSLRPRSDTGGLGLGTVHGARFVGEVNAYAAADMVLTVSDAEARLVNALVADDGAARAVPDFEDIAPSAVPFEERRGLVFIGGFQHPPNAEAVGYLCRTILPRVDARILDEHPVYIVGNALDDSVRDLGRGLPQVRMVGWVPFVEPYLERARASLVPLLHGAGTKRKLLQSLMAGTPAVSTSIGAEGFDIRDEEHVLIADDPDRFARCIERIVWDADLWRRLAVAGREAVLRTNGREVARSAFTSAIEEAMRREPKRIVPLGVDMRRYVYRPRAMAPTPERLVAAVRSVCPPGSRILVMTNGNADWLTVPGYQTTPFPQERDGTWSAQRSWGKDDLVSHLGSLVATGVSHLVVAAPAFEALDERPALRQHLDEHGRVVHRDESAVIIALEHASNGHAERDIGSLRSGPAIATATPATATTVTMPTHPPADAQPPATPRAATASGPSSDVRVLAFYLPQFHPIPENDEWWGPGFTEWRNVARADPLFEGHYQPHVPADLGFYDLRLAETRIQQAELARAHGIHGFVWYHYWFQGRRLLGRPFDEVLRSGEPDFPFALCWANDPWSRRWDGREDELLMAQTYSADDDLAHMRWLMPALSDPRAIRVDGRPMFLVYRGNHIPDPARTTDIWRTEALRAGLPGLHLVAIETGWDLGWDATRVGFDAKVLFQPQFGWLMTSHSVRDALIEFPEYPELQVYDYDLVRRAAERMEPVPYTRYETVVPGWDNTPRRGDRAVILLGANPASYEEWLGGAVERARNLPADRRLVFINAWNEWAEGCHLEPDRRYGYAYLEATARVVGTPRAELVPALGRG
jgi:glycosyltransferase involved in cell wall biosynthesis